MKKSFYSQNVVVRCSCIYCLQYQVNLGSFLVLLMLAASVTHYSVLFVVLLMIILYCMLSVNNTLSFCFHIYDNFLVRR